MAFISLGNTCGVAYQLQQHGVRSKAFPFDWVRSPSFAKVNLIIDNNFKDFTKVKFGKISTQHPLITDDFVQNKIETTLATNKYGTKFYHDFSNSVTSLEIEQFEEKYERRINRFYEVIKNNKIHFIRDEYFYPNLEKDIIEFKTVINKFCPDYVLTVIIHSKTHHNINILDVNIILDENEYGDWQRPNVDWSNIILSFQSSL